ncbi:MAG: hypothetical protein AB1351_00280 [Thermoproteota archaeon]
MNNAFESIAWVGLGFAPTLVAMEVAWRLAQKKRRSHEKLVTEVNIQQ